MFILCVTEYKYSPQVALPVSTYDNDYKQPGFLDYYGMDHIKLLWEKFVAGLEWFFPWICNEGYGSMYELSCIACFCWTRISQLDTVHILFSWL